MEGLLMQDKEETLKLNNTGFEVVEEKVEKLEKNKFFDILRMELTGKELTVLNIGKTYISKFKNDDGNRPSGFFIDFGFEHENKEYEVGITYNVGVPVADETFIIGSKSNLFLLLSLVYDLKGAEKIKVTKQAIEDELVGLKFLARAGIGFNGYIIDPVKVIKTDNTGK